ncbi:MAG: DNA polymerase III subunit delta [Pseudomonadota bacterium]|nr:DNA polymerase III subunit delta [Pseudomonadota bacterium]
MILKRRADIERFLKAPDAAIRAALIYGPDMGVVRERAQALAASATARPDDPFDVALLAEADLTDDGARLEEELAAFSMMGGRRLVRLRLGAEAKESAAAAQALARHLAGDFNGHALFLIEAGNLKADSPLRKAAQKGEACAVIACYADEPGDLAHFTREALAAEKLGLTSEAVELFVSRLPQERGVARQEIERLVLFLGPGGGRVADAAELTDFLGVEPQASLADAAIDAFGGRLGAAQAGLRRASQQGEDGPAAVRALSAHLGRLRRAAALHQAGPPLTQVARDMKIFWKNEREFIRQARAWTLGEIDRLQPEILAADQACKTTGAPDRLIGERLALAIAGRARRLGL